MIITFYSYKGGVGRSQLLANLAAYFSMFEFKKILLIDWDLEAPGINYYFNKSTKEVNKLGLLDVFKEYVKLRRSGKEVNQITDLPVFTEKRHITKLVEHKHPYSEILKGKVSMISAGINQDRKDYQQSVVDFNWYEFYELLDGKRYLEYLKDVILKLGYDFVFIDSRTGLHDYADICNIQMPQINVLVAAPTKQNFEGCEYIAERISKSPYVKNGNFRNPIVMPVISRVEKDAPDFKNFYIDFKSKFSYLIKNIEKYYDDFISEDFEFFNDTMLTYNRYVAIGENIIFKKKDEDLFGLAKQYQNITGYLKYLKKEIDVTLFQKKIYGNLRNRTRKISYIEWNTKGADYFNLGEYKKAVELYEKALEIKPDFYHALYNNGNAYSKLRDYDKSIKFLRKALEIKPDNHKAWYNLGTTYSKLKNYEKAEKCHKKAISIKPDKYEALYNLGNTYYRLGKYEEAKKYYKKVIKIKPKEYESYSNLGNTCYRLGKYEEAENYYKKAIEINSNLFGAWYNLGLRYSVLKKYKEAEKSYKKALEIKPDFTHAYYNLACLYSLQKQKTETLKYLKKSIELSPEYKIISKEDKYFKHLWNDKLFLEITK